MVGYRKSALLSSRMVINTSVCLKMADLMVKVRCTTRALCLVHLEMSGISHSTKVTSDKVCVMVKVKWFGLMVLSFMEPGTMIKESREP